MLVTIWQRRRLDRRLRYRHWRIAAVRWIDPLAIKRGEDGAGRRCDDAMIACDAPVLCATAKNMSRGNLNRYKVVFELSLTHYEDQNNLWSDLTCPDCIRLAQEVHNVEIKPDQDFVEL